MPKPKTKLNMKTTKVLLLGAAVAAFTFTAFAGTGAYLLKAPAASNGNSPADTTLTTIAYVDSTPAFLTPRAQGNQAKVIKGTNNDSNSTLACRNMMSTSNPKAVAECNSHATMPGCVTVAPLK
jgi:hypothetical protein